MADDKPLVDAFESLRLKHLMFRRAEPAEMREIEAMRMEVLKVQAASSSAPGSLAVAGMQLRLMERTFHVLRLVHFANAPENHGWMNLFREWGRDPRFNAQYEALRHTLSPQFVAFYDTYLCRYVETMEKRPIRHPWLPRRPGDRGVGIFMDTGRTEPLLVPASDRPGADGIDDAKGHAGADQAYEEPSGGTPGDSGPPVPNA